MREGNNSCSWDLPKSVTSMEHFRDRWYDSMVQNSTIHRTEAPDHYTQTEPYRTDHSTQVLIYYISRNLGIQTFCLIFLSDLRQTFIFDYAVWDEIQNGGRTTWTRWLPSCSNMYVAVTKKLPTAVQFLKPAWAFESANFYWVLSKRESNKKRGREQWVWQTDKKRQRDKFCTQPSDYTW